MIRSGPPLPPAIFIGSAMMCAPWAGSWLRPATFSKIGTFAPQRATVTPGCEIVQPTAHCGKVHWQWAAV